MKNKQDKKKVNNNDTNIDDNVKPVKEKKKIKFNKALFLKIIYYFTLISFIIPIAFLIYKIIVTDENEIVDGLSRSREDYILMLIQCLLGAVVIHIPAIFQKKLHMEIPTFLYVFYIIFLYCAIFLGEVRNFYYVVPYWDSILHSFSAVMLGLFGFIVVDFLNRGFTKSVSLRPIFVAVFALCFAMTVGVLWEIYEFSVDGIFKSNMQKYITADGTVLVGHQALTDTMKDLILDFVGSFVGSAIGFVSILKRGKKKDKVNEATVEEAHN